MNGRRSVLVLGPHTDDGELGCGGSIARWLDEGHAVAYAVFSSCRRSVPEGFPEDVLEHELREATRRLGLDPDRDVELLDYEVREFSGHRQPILEDLVRLRRERDPDLVVLPATTDVHQDHATISLEGIRAFKQRSILGYEEPWNTIRFSANAFETLEQQHLRTKIHALAAYESQGHRDYFREDFVRSLAVTRGVQAGVGLAEAFEVIRWRL